MVKLELDIAIAIIFIGLYMYVHTVLAHIINEIKIRKNPRNDLFVIFIILPPFLIFTY